jgi:hypothetical protein
MHRSRVIVVLGAIVALLPLLGFPSAWEAVFQVLAGLAIVAVSVWSQIDRKLSQKAKAQLRAQRKTGFTASEASLTSDPNAPKMVEGVPHFGKRVTDFYPKTGQPGRRRSDIAPTLSPEGKFPAASADFEAEAEPSEGEGESII